MKFVESLRRVFPFALVLIVSFFGVPALCRGLPTQAGEALLSSCLLSVYPPATFLCGFVFGCRHGFHISLPLCALVLFLIACLLFFGWPGLLFALIYFACALVGCLAGLGIRKLTEKWYY